jgi:hypothetical protein
MPVVTRIWCNLLKVRDLHLRFLFGLRAVLRLLLSKGDSSSSLEKLGGWQWQQGDINLRSVSSYR